MINEFIAKTVRIMKSSDIKIRLPEHRQVEIGQTTTVFINCSDSFCQTNLEDNLIFHVIVFFSFGNTQFNLQLNKTSLELIYSVILLVLDGNGYAEQYLLGLMRTYYDDLKSGIIAISDDFGQNNLANISNDLRLKRIIRYKLTNPEYNLDTSTGVISIVRYNMQPNEIHYYSCDYLIALDGKKYLVPHEVLNTDGTIMLSEIMHWELEDVV